MIAGRPAIKHNGWPNGPKTADAETLSGNCCREEQRKIIRYNHLVANLVVFHNVVNMTRVLQELIDEGYPVTPEIIARLAASTKSEAECTTSETYKLVALGAP
jgi:hypothetical protein